jgi:flagellar basal body rod protein FlgG
MMVNAAAEDALERIAQRATDVQRAFTPGATSPFGDVVAEQAGSRATLDPLSVAAPPDAYFITTDERGRAVYTRDGGFALHGGTLTGADGRAILGFRSTTSATSELHVDDVDAALGRVNDLRIESDGTLAYDRAIVDPRTGARERERVAVGRVALARFPAATKLGASDANHFFAPHGVLPHVGRAGDGNFAHVAPMQRETSRIDLDRSLDRLEEAYVAFDALQAAHKAQGGVGKTAMDLLK